MKSRHAEHFNHDDEASGYDADVADESNPIRTGYSALLDWVVARAAAGPESAVLDLGCGSGNLSQRLSFRQLVGVDVSPQMLALARSKLGGRGQVDLVEGDLLAFFDHAPRFDAIVSTYAVHHLEDDEKRELFARVRAHLLPGGRAVFGDLMYPSRSERTTVEAELRLAGHGDAVDDLADEFPWYVDEAVGELEQLGVTVTARRFSVLSWGISAIID